MKTAQREPFRVPDLITSKSSSRKIAALTAYDYTMAALLDAAGIDLILVGDSVSSIVQGHESTIPVTLDEMIYHCRCVSRAARFALVVGDMPFMSYQVSVEQGVAAAGRLIKEGGVAAVKVEGGLFVAPLIERLTQIDIPVIGHVGLTPQSYHRMGGHRLQGKQSDADGSLAAGTRERVIEDARAVAGAGACAVVLEGIPAGLAGEITREIPIPTIGIGAGTQCDGQILVTHDMVGLTTRHAPKFVRRLADLGTQIVSAAEKFAEITRADAQSADQRENIYATRS